MHTKRDNSIIFVVSLEARKNVIFLLKIFKKLISINNEYKLTIIGDGPEKNKLIEFAKENRLPVNFLGRLSHSMVMDELSNHQIYLHTSVKESFSYSLLEAKLAGLKTCASSDLQVPAEFIDVSISSFKVDDWCSAILNIDYYKDSFNAQNYSVERMTLSTCRMAR